MKLYIPKEEDYFKSYSKELEEYIERLEHENERIYTRLDDKDKEIERLNNIIKELEKWLDEKYQYADKHIFPGSMAGVIMGQINRTKSKLQELKDSDKE